MQGGITMLSWTAGTYHHLSAAKVNLMDVFSKQPLSAAALRSQAQIMRKAFA